MKLYTVKEIAKRYNVHQDTIRKAVTTKNITAHAKRGHAYLYDINDFNYFRQVVLNVVQKKYIYETFFIYPSKLNNKTK